MVKGGIMASTVKTETTVTQECEPCSKGRFRYWCQKVLPAVYDDALSYYELMCKIQSHMNVIITEVNKEGEGIEELQKRVQELEDLFKQFQEHGFDDFYLDQIDKWMQDNMWCLMSWGSRIVWFGITDDGYFAAYIPDNFNFLAFDVIMDAESPDYGKLMLSYCQEVYEPCQIPCWDGDCLQADVTKLPVGDGSCGCGSRGCEGQWKGCAK